MTNAERLERLKKAGNILDDAVLDAGNMQDPHDGPDAQSRITRTPIRFHNETGSTDYPPEYLTKKAIAGHDINGSFDRDPASFPTWDFVNHRFSTVPPGIDITRGKHGEGIPSWKIFNQILAHEDVHAVHSDQPYQDVPPSPNDQVMRNGWAHGGFMGKLIQELPSQAATFLPGTLPNVRQSDADQWYETYLSQLPEGAAKKLQAIRKAFQASQDFAAHYGR